MSVSPVPQGVLPVETMAAELAQFIAMHGRLVLHDRPRLLRELREAMPGLARPFNLLMAAYDAGVVDLFAMAGTSPDVMAADRMAHSIADMSGTQIDLARWAVDVWQRALSPGPAYTVAPPPSAPTAAPASPVPPVAPIVATPASSPAEDLSWDDEPNPAPPTPAAAAAIPTAPSVPASAPSAPSVAAGTALASPPPYAPAQRSKGSILKWIGIAIVLIVAAVGGLYAVGLLQIPSQWFDTSWTSPDEPTEEPGKKMVIASYQVLVPLGQPVTAAQVKEANNDIIVDGFRNSKEPTFPSAYKVDGSEEHWQFEFNVKDPGGKRFAYHVNMIGRKDNRPSQGVITAIDRSLSDNKMLSVSNMADVENKPNDYSIGHFVWKLTWSKNPSGVPPVCVMLYTTNTQPGPDRRPAIFFIKKVNDDGSCGNDIGSGELQ